jgi:hypothetical protein
MIIMRVEHAANGENGIAAWPIFDDDRLPPLYGKLVGHQPGGDVDAGARSQRDDESDRALRPWLCLRFCELSGRKRRRCAKDNGTKGLAQTWH